MPSAFACAVLGDTRAAPADKPIGVGATATVVDEVVEIVVVVMVLVVVVVVAAAALVVGATVVLAVIIGLALSVSTAVGA